MIEVKAYDSEGNETEALRVEEAWFGTHLRAEVLRRAILMYEANRRQGSANTLRRSEVAGSNRKLDRQKHTSRARVGDRSAPHRRGGASTFGPRPRDFRFSMPKKALRAALDSALLAKLRDGQVVVGACGTPEAPKTKPVAEYLARIGVEKGVSCLYVTAETDGVFYRSARNIRGLSVMPLDELSAYAVVRPRWVVFSSEAFEKLLERRR